MVLGMLWREFFRRAALNAVFGYLDPTLPAPEVFERPHWRVLWAAEGARELAILVFENRPASAVSAPPEPSALVLPQEDRVLPLVRCTCEFWWHPGEKRWYGLGIHVHERLWVVFHGAAA